MSHAGAAAPEVSVVMPCLNEEAAIGACIEKIRRTFDQAGLDGEIVVCDNGSTDRSVAIAEAMGARVVHQPERGYGNAYLKGFDSARGRYLVMGDADDTYDFTLIPEFLKALREGGNAFVTGSRYLGGGDGNITGLHRWFGNPALTRILNALFGTRYTDVYCGFRAFSREAYERIRPVSPGMEFNLELAINAGLAGLKTAEIPIVLAPRKGESKLRTFRDGWRSLRMMLLYSPNQLFLVPGSVLLSLGLLLHVAVLLGLVRFGGRPAAGVTAVFATVLSVVGFEILSLGLHAKTYSWSRRFDHDNRFLGGFYSRFTLETGLLMGLGLALAGLAILATIVVEWVKSDLLPLPHPEWASFGATLDHPRTEHGVLLVVHLGHVHEAARGTAMTEPAESRPWSTIELRLAALIVLIAAALWAPRLRGPLDLRYDAGVYYILGRSLAEGHGYRLLNEPGAIEAIQYPPVLPAVAALHRAGPGNQRSRRGRPCAPAHDGAAVSRVRPCVVRAGATVPVAGFAFAAALLAILNAQVVFSPTTSRPTCPTPPSPCSSSSTRRIRGGGTRRDGIRPAHRRRGAARRVGGAEPGATPLA